MDPMAFGGVPNVMVADQNGKASMERHIGFCPTTTETLLSVNLAWHSDGLL